MARLKSLIICESRRIVFIASLVAAVAAGGAKVGNAMAGQDPADQAAKQKEKRIAAGEPEAKQLLLLMDRDQNGKVSKQEFMNFMEAEFQRLDINKDGELDVKELVQSRIVPRGGVHR
jgi:hypothetical protein